MSRHSFVSSALAEERRTASDGIVKGGEPFTSSLRERRGWSLIGERSEPPFRLLMQDMGRP